MMSSLWQQFLVWLLLALDHSGNAITAAAEGGAEGRITRPTLLARKSCKELCIMEIAARREQCISDVDARQEKLKGTSPEHHHATELKNALEMCDLIKAHHEENRCAQKCNSEL